MANFGGTGFGDIAMVPGPSLKHPKGIRDVEEWYVSTLTRRDYVYSVFERQCEIGIANLERVHAAVGDRVDVVLVTGTDFGTQQGPFISPATYRDLFMPFHKAVNDWVHAHTTWKTFIHSCGSVSALIPDFIEAGFDILNPVQCSAADMDPRDLKRRFGDRDHLLGRRRGHAADAAVRHARRGAPRGARAHRASSPPAAASSSTPSTTSRPASRSRTCWPCSRRRGGTGGGWARPPRPRP